LLLATGQLGGTVIESLTEAHHIGQIETTLMLLARQRFPLIEQWNLNVLYDSKLLYQVVGLKYESDPPRTNIGELIVRHLGDIIVP
jgi:hypothetical protein